MSESHYQPADRDPVDPFDPTEPCPWTSEQCMNEFYAKAIRSGMFSGVTKHEITPETGNWVVYLMVHINCIGGGRVETTVGIAKLEIWRNPGKRYELMRQRLIESVVYLREVAKDTGVMPVK